MNIRNYVCVIIYGLCLVVTVTRSETVNEQQYNTVNEQQCPTVDDNQCTKEIQNVVTYTEEPVWGFVVDMPIYRTKAGQVNISVFDSDIDTTVQNVPELLSQIAVQIHSARQVGAAVSPVVVPTVAAGYTAAAAFSAAAGYAAGAALPVAAGLYNGAIAYDYNNDLAGQDYPLAEPYVDVQVAAEPYVHVDIPAEPYVHEEIPAEPYIHQEPIQVAAVAAAPVATYHAAPTYTYAAAPTYTYAAAPAYNYAAPAYYGAAIAPAGKNVLNRREIVF